MKITRKSVLLFLIACFFGIGVFGFYQSQIYKKKVLDLQNQVGSLSNSIKGLEKNQQSNVPSVQQNGAGLQNQENPQATSDSGNNKTIQNQALPTQNQEQLITSAVAKITPSVVSIVISKYSPNLDVTYVNPFGNDPYFKDFGFEIPVYQQKGVSKQKVGAGTGLIIDPKGYVLTNKHVVSDTEAEYTVLLSNGNQKNAKVIYKDPTNDVAILKIDGTYPNIATLGDSSSLKLGQTVIAVGNALGEYNNTVSVGSVSGLNRNIEAGDENSTSTEKLNGVIQTDVSVNPGNSGGPLTNLYGDVIGINVATAVDSNNINFSIPINSVKNSIKNIIPK